MLQMKLRQIFKAAPLLKNPPSNWKTLQSNLSGSSRTLFRFIPPTDGWAGMRTASLYLAKGLNTIWNP